MRSANLTRAERNTSGSDAVENMQENVVDGKRRANKEEVIIDDAKSELAETTAFLDEARYGPTVSLRAVIHTVARQGHGAVCTPILLLCRPVAELDMHVPMPTWPFATVAVDRCAVLAEHRCSRNDLQSGNAHVTRILTPPPAPL